MMKTVLALASFAACQAALAGTAGLEAKLQCSARMGNQDVSWQVEIHDNLPLATVDDFDTPADYSASHVRVRLDARGPVLFIGRVTGRMVLSSPDGQTLARGQCTGGMPT